MQQSELDRLRADYATAVDTHLAYEGDPNDPPMIRSVTCHTPNCENGEIVITFVCVSRIICGACGQDILDIIDHPELLEV